MQKLDSNLYRLYYRLKQLSPVGEKMIPQPIVWKDQAQLTPPSQNFLSELDDDELKRLDTIVKEAELVSRIHSKFPSTLTDKYWAKLMESKNRKERLETLKFVWQNEKKSEKDVAKKKLKQDRTVIPESQGIFFDPPIEKIERWNTQMESMRFVRALQLKDTPMLAVDCRFIPYLSQRAQGLTSIQLAYLISKNRYRSNPWPLYFVNYDFQDKVMQDCTRKHLSSINNKRNVTSIVTDQNYTDLFDKSKIIYLSPDAEEPLTSIEADTTYVIGGIVDRVAEKNIPRYASLEVSQVDGVRAFRLPLDEYVTWQAGTKFLTLVTVMKILQMSFENGGNWKETLQTLIPQRYVTPPSEKNPLARKIPAIQSYYDQEVLRILEEKLGKEPLDVRRVKRDNYSHH